MHISKIGLAQDQADYFGLETHKKLTLTSLHDTDTSVVYAFDSEALIIFALC
jgi:hypothetical protein